MGDNRISCGAGVVAAPFTLQDDVKNVGLYYACSVAAMIQATAAVIEPSFTLASGDTAPSSMVWVVALHEVAGPTETTGVVAATLGEATAASTGPATVSGALTGTRSEERRVGKESGST